MDVCERALVYVRMYSSVVLCRWLCFSLSLMCVGTPYISPTLLWPRKTMAILIFVCDLYVVYVLSLLYFRCHRHRCHTANPADELFLFLIIPSSVCRPRARALFNQHTRQSMLFCRPSFSHFTWCGKQAPHHARSPPLRSTALLSVWKSPRKIIFFEAHFCQAENQDLLKCLRWCCYCWYFFLFWKSIHLLPFIYNRRHRFKIVWF